MLRNFHSGCASRLWSKSRCAYLVQSLALGLLAGCLSPAKFPPVNMAEPGWRLEQGQALWRPKADMPELAGELLLATHSGGQSFVQFSKAPLTLVEARRMTNEWAIRFPANQLGFSGKGSPPVRFGWLYLEAALRGVPLPKQWHFSRKSDGGWRLENQRTGESIEGFLEP